MSNEAQNSDALAEALQGVIDRVTSYEESATDDTIDDQLHDALTQAGVQLDEATVHRLAEDISEDAEHVEASDYL